MDKAKLNTPYIANDMDELQNILWLLSEWIHAQGESSAIIGNNQTSIKDRLSGIAGELQSLQADLAMPFLNEVVGFKALNPIAQRLYLWFVSHKTSNSIGFVRFHEICGCTSPLDSEDWFNSVNGAMDLLVSEKLFKSAVVLDSNIIIVR